MCATHSTPAASRQGDRSLASLEGRNRVLVLGSGGPGKSTLARQLGERLGLPVIHLDSHYWSSGWKPTPEVEWQQRAQQLAQGERRVMDGDYSGSLALRLARCDAAVFLDVSSYLGVCSVLRRWLCFRHAQRPELPEGCPEKLDFDTGETKGRYQSIAKQIAVGHGRCARTQRAGGMPMCLRTHLCGPGWRAQDRLPSVWPSATRQSGIGPPANGSICCIDNYMLDC